MTDEAIRPESEVPVLYGYWRSSSAYRVRIALNLKGIKYRQQAIHLVRDGGEQNSQAYRKINPLGLVPALVYRGQAVVQSIAICEFLEDVFPQTPLLPAEPFQRARVRAFAQSVASEVQPLNNVAVLNYLKGTLAQDDAAVAAWYRCWIDRAFSALEAWLQQTPQQSCSFGSEPGLADCFLVPQVYNAERFDCDLSKFPRIRAVTAHLRSLKAFHEAAPENQPDAE